MLRVFLGCLVLAFALCGCASVNNCSGKAFVPKVYQASTDVLKTQLASDLRSNKIILGSAIEDIESVYGQPDSILVSGCSARLIYRQEKAKNITLWFEQGKLNSWSN